MWNGLLARRASSGHRPRARSRRHPHIEICPPAPTAMVEVELGWSMRLLAWLTQGWHSAELSAGSTEPPPAVTPLTLVRFEFIGCLDDVPTRQAAELAARIRRARSLRELWHLRADLFNVVSRHCDQDEAAARLQRLNRHFPTRLGLSAS